ncbi:MAG: ferritin family protein [Halieaceae bacterium]|nr:ferritin family protein [Halieaceae bacterium]
MTGSAELQRFLAHAVELEEEAMTRYQELAEALRAHNNLMVAEFFESMAEEAAKHLAEVREAATDDALPRLAPWEFDWPAEAPESASYEAVHYRMDLRQALELALANERSAGAFYAEFAAATDDEATARLAASYADEEAEHARRLQERLNELPPTSPSQFEDDDPAHSPE